MAALTKVSLLAAVALAGCCINPTPMPAPRPMTVTSAPIPSGAAQWDGGVLHIGTTGFNGYGAFQPLADGVVLATGAQGGGGRHVFLAYRVTGIPVSGELVMTARIQKSDGTLVGSIVHPVSFERTDGGWDSSYSQRVVLCPTPAGVGIVGDTLRVDAWAQFGENGPLATTASATFRPDCAGSCADDCGP